MGVGWIEIPACTLCIPSRWGLAAASDLDRAPECAARGVNSACFMSCQVSLSAARRVMKALLSGALCTSIPKQILSLEPSAGASPGIKTKKSFFLK